MDIILLNIYFSSNDTCHAWNVCSIVDVDSIHLVHALSADHDRVDVATQVALATDGGGDRGGNC